MVAVTKYAWSRKQEGDEAWNNKKKIFPVGDKSFKEKKIFYIITWAWHWAKTAVQLPQLGIWKPLSAGLASYYYLCNLRAVWLEGEVTSLNMHNSPWEEQVIERETAVSGAHAFSPFLSPILSSSSCGWWSLPIFSSTIQVLRYSCTSDNSSKIWCQWRDRLFLFASNEKQGSAFRLQRIL